MTNLCAYTVFALVTLFGLYVCDLLGCPPSIFTPRVKVTWRHTGSRGRRISRLRPQQSCDTAVSRKIQRTGAPIGEFCNKACWPYCSSVDSIHVPSQKEKSSFWFKSANCSVMIWGCLRSGLGTASQQGSWMYWMTRLSWLMDFFFPDGSGIFQDHNAKINWLLLWKSWAWGQMSVREHEESFSHMNWPIQSLDFNTIESIWG